MDKAISQKILKNFSSLIIAQLIYKLCTFIVMILIARFLRPDALGRISYGFSFVWAFLFLSDFGLSELFIRDVSRERHLREKYVNNIITLKILIGLISYLVIILIALRLSLDIDKFWIIMILGTSVILDSFMYFFRCLFLVYNNGYASQNNTILSINEILSNPDLLFQFSRHIPNFEIGGFLKVLKTMQFEAKSIRVKGQNPFGRLFYYLNMLSVWKK